MADQYNTPRPDTVRSEPLPPDEAHELVLDLERHGVDTDQVTVETEPPRTVPEVSAVDNATVRRQARRAVLGAVGLAVMTDPAGVARSDHGTGWAAPPPLVPGPHRAEPRSRRSAQVRGTPPDVWPTDPGVARFRIDQLSEGRHPMTNEPHHSVPGLEEGRAMQVVSVLEERLVALLDLQLVLKHIHWNVVGPNFISVHEMLDGEVATVRDEVDEMAERIRTLGGTPRGTVQAIVDRRTWADYPLDRALAMLHLEELDKVYDGVIADHRKAMSMVSDLDPVTEDLLIGQIAKLELFQWFVRSFVERSHEPGDDASSTVPANVQRSGGADQSQTTNNNQPEGVAR